MRLRAWALLALSSLWLRPATAATRPRYGGTLTVELSANFAALDPSEMPGAISPLIAETLVRFNAKGDIEPLLAVNWQRDADRKRWRFSLRTKVAFHDGEALSGANATPSLLAALKKKYPDVVVTAGGQTIVVQSERPMPDLLIDLARPQSAVFRKSDSAPLIGTGPFRAGAWEPGRRLTLAAFDDYWGGRPFLDSVVLDLTSARERADVFDIPFRTTRRVLPEGTRIRSSPARELVGLLMGDMPPAVRQALALVIDRAPLVNVLTQRKGEAAFGLLPQWLSGYAFTFQTSPDASRARQIVSQLRLTPLTLSYPAGDSFTKSVAERIALNARDAGITLQPTQNPSGNLHLVRWPLETADAATELARLAAALGAPDRAGALNPAKPETLYEAERALLEDHRLIPLLHLPEVYGLAPRVHNWDSAEKGAVFTLHLESLWVDP